MFIPQPEKDIRLKISTRNARVLRRIERTGLSIKKFCDQYQLSYSEVINLLGFKKAPINQKGDWRPICYFISSALRCEPEELWPEWMRHIEKRRGTMQIDVAVPETVLLDERVLDLPKMLEYVPPRTREMLQRHIGLGEPLEDIGKDHHVSRDRVRQICAKGIRQIREHFQTEGWKVFKTKTQTLQELVKHFKAEQQRAIAHEVIGRTVQSGDILFRVLEHDPESFATTMLAYHHGNLKSKLVVILWNPEMRSMQECVEYFLERNPWPDDEKAE